MTDKLREAAQQALEALKLSTPKTRRADDDYAEQGWKEHDAAIAAIRAALAQEPEPVAWMYHGIRHDGTPHDRPSLIWRPEYMDAMSASKGAQATPLYTAPPQRPPLTDEEIRAHADKHLRYQPQSYEASGVFDLVRAIERKVRGEA